jgi:hypothetical protein
MTVVGTKGAYCGGDGLTIVAESTISVRRGGATNAA